jgi:cyclase
MLKKRIIPIMLLSNGRLVKSKQFADFRDVGDPVKSASVYNSQYTDELLLLNINRKDRSLEQLAQLIKKISEVSFMPLTVGGGIQSFDDAAYLIRHGADKVLINSCVYHQPQIITDVANSFGSQAVIVGIDVRKEPKTNSYQLYSNCGKTLEPISLEQHIESCQALGIGELMVQSINHDGKMQGFDITLLERVMAIATVPVIGCSGSGNYQHLREAFSKTEISALGCGSLFNFSDSNPIRAKNYLTNYGINFKVV